jgi:hypothetical protein
MGSAPPARLCEHGERRDTMMRAAAKKEAAEAKEAKESAKTATEPAPPASTTSAEGT